MAKSKKKNSNLKIKNQKLWRNNQICYLIIDGYFNLLNGSIKFIKIMIQYYH